MENFVVVLVSVIAPLMLWLTLLPSSWLNARSYRVGRVAETAAWMGFTAAAFAVALWAVGPREPIVASVTSAGWVGIRFDGLSATLLLLVCFLGGVILRFSRNYLQGDAKQGYFFKWMCLALGAVMALALAPGLVQFGLAWIAMSLGLHKLLVYFPDRLGTLLSARKKFCISRVGDLCLAGAFFGIYSLFGTQDFGELFAKVESGAASLSSHSWIGWLIVLGALLKSAQFPFHTWLPDTMGAPTPVSALMHAGIINGGGYLVVRLSPVLVTAQAALPILAVAGALTAVYASMVMLSQTSVKRALAYSTIAQMGFMLFQCGVGAFHLAILHIVAHSLYKAHAFLSSGSAVDMAKRLSADSQYVSLPQNRIWVAVGLSGVVVLTVGFLWGVSPSEKPGLLVLGMVLVMALTQLLWTQMRRGKRGLALLKGVSLAAALAVGYFALSSGAEWVLEGSLPVMAPLSLSFELALSLALFAFLITSIRFQDGEPGFLTVAFKRRLYVHALNGFYLNTLANRAARKLGLVPANR